MFIGSLNPLRPNEQTRQEAYGILVQENVSLLLFQGIYLILLLPMNLLICVVT